MSELETKKTVSFFGRLGPGLLLAATSIGASHLVMAPKAGWMFGFQLLWLVPLTHLFKYHAFEFGPRYAAATGESLIAGYARMPGPRGWALWILLAGTVAQGIGVLAAVVGIAAAVLSTFIGHAPFAGFYISLVIGSWMYYVFMVAAFTAMYSTVYAVMDGFSRSFAETVSTLFPKIRAQWQTRLYWGFVLFTAAFAFLTLVALKGRNPIALVLDVGFLSLCIAPLYCVLNYTCVTRLIKDEQFRPGPLARLIAMAGIVVVGVGTLVCAASKFGILK